MEDINIALLIDADNISSKYIPTILSELSKYGKITIRRMYGDWSQDRLRSWLNKSAGYSLTPVMQLNNTPGKNASDISLIIDAMDTLYAHSVQGFCIVSSDGDFNKLATRLREAGMVVIGMGERKTPESFRVSCERFIFLDVITGNADAEEEDSPKSRAKGKSGTRRKNTRSSSQNTAASSGKGKTASGKAAAGSSGSSASGPGVSASASGAGSAAAGTVAAEPVTSYSDSGYDHFLPGDYDLDEPEDTEENTSDNAITSKEEIEAAIVKMITDNAADGKETGLGEVGSRLVKIFPDFDIRNYHYSKLSEFLKDLPSLNVTTRDSGVWISQKITADSEIEKQIQSIFRKHNTDDMNISTLKQELEDLNPNLDATIRRSGVTRFSVYLNRNIHSVEVNGRHVTLLPQK